MKLAEAITILENHNAWRRNESDAMPEMWPANHAKNLGIAIEVVLRAAKECDTAMLVLNQIAEKTRKTKEQRLANACVKFPARHDLRK